MFWLILTLLILSALWFVAVSKFAGPDLSNWDSTAGEVFTDHPDDQEHCALVLKDLVELKNKSRAQRSIKKSFALTREYADNLSDQYPTDCTFTSVIANGVPCEWALAPKADPSRRVLMLHGGAFLLGSPKGHRIYAHHLSHLANAAVLSVDYSLMPEHRRMQATLDAQAAYHWILSHGPEGVTPLDKLVIAGDSAGGNLAIMLSHWSRKFAARQPDAVVAVAPTLDATLASPSIKANLASDKILGEGLGFLSKLPRPLALWVGAFLFRCNPSNVLISPLFDDLSELPPTLLQASNTECLLGDSIRYANKAKAAGSDVTLQIWQNQFHDWQIFTPDSGSGKQAWSEIGKFLEQKL